MITTRPHKSVALSWSHRPDTTSFPQISRCFELLRGLHEKQARFWFLSLSEPQHLQNVYDEHLAILDALERRDVPAARDAVREHIDEFRRTITRTP